MSEEQVALPDRRINDGDRREKPFAGYGSREGLDPDNCRIEVRRWYKNRNRGRPQPLPAWDQLSTGRWPSGRKETKDE